MLLTLRTTRLPATEVTTRERTTRLAVLHNDLVGNPWGTYEQDEPCVGCGAKLVRPSTRGLGRRVASKAAHLINRASMPLLRPRPSWVHVLFRKKLNAPN